MQALGKGLSTHRLRTAGLQEAGGLYQNSHPRACSDQSAQFSLESREAAQMKSSAAESNEGQPGFVRFCMRCPGGVGGEARKFSEWCVCVCGRVQPCI